jgi:DNA-binding LacI/PurR family transcriptional regulator
MATRKKAQGARAALREMILSGRFKPGTFLPSVRELAAEIEMPKSTIHVILKMLQDEGLIQLQPKRRGALVLDTGKRKKTLHRVFMRPSDFGYFGGRTEASKILSGACVAAERRYIDVMLSFSDSINIMDEISSLYRDDLIQGIVYLSCKDRDLVIKPVEQLNIPYVVVNNVYGAKAVGCGQDFRGIARNAVRYLYKHGHRRIGILYGTPDEFIYSESLAGFRGALAEEELEINPDWILMQGGPEKKSKYLKQIISLLESDNAPTAFYTVRDYRAAFLYEACDQIGLKIPDDLSVISYDNINWPEAAGRGLTTFQEPTVELGECAVDMLNHWVTTGEIPENRIVKSPLIERWSVKKI